MGLAGKGGSNSMKSSAQQKADLDYRINRARLAGAKIIPFSGRKKEA
jgi:hypothetical protein